MSDWQRKKAIVEWSDKSNSFSVDRIITKMDDDVLTTSTSSKKFNSLKDTLDCVEAFLSTNGYK